MRRPNRAWCAIVLGLAVLVGCAKKPKSDTVASGQTQPTPPPAVPAAKGQPGTNLPPAGRTNTVYTADGPLNPPMPTAAPTLAGGVTAAGGATAGAGGPVEMVQCRFDLVETALTAAKGKVVLVDCWARWCPPCISSFPKLVEKHGHYSSKGLVCISVSLDSGRKAFNTTQVHAFLKEQKATFQNFYLTDLRADNAAMEKRFGKIEGIPHGVLFNKKGEKVWEGHPMDTKLVGKIEAELAK